MVIGNGLIGTTFSNYKANSKILIFASGVSNSSTKNKDDFEREKTLFLDIISKTHDRKIVYFSTCSIYDKSVINNSYVKHKLEMEMLVKKNSPTYLIFRVSNVVGKTNNPNTLINNFVNAILNNAKLHIWKKAERNIIDIDDVKFIVERKINSGIENKTINVAVRQSESVLDILSQIERHLCKKSAYTLIQKGSKLDIDTSEINEELHMIESKKGKGLTYLDILLDKYYKL